MSGLLLFGKNRFEKHKTGLFNGLRSTILQNTNATFCLLTFFFFWDLKSSFLKQAVIKTSPSIPGLERDLHSRTLTNGGYCRSKTGT